MKKRKVVNLIILLAVLVFLAVTYILLKNHNQAEEEAEESEETSEIMSVNVDNIKSIGFKISGEDVVFVKNEDAWALESDDSFPVKADQMTVLTDALTEVTANRTLENVEDLSEYGLDKPQNVIQIVTKDDGNIKITVGNSNESTGSCYVYLNDDKNTVYTTDSDLSTVFAGSLMNYAEGENYPTIVGSNVEKVELDQGQHSFVLQNSDTADSGWSYTDASGNVSDAESSAVSSLQSAIAGFTYANYYDYNCENPAEYGLEKPYATLKVTYTVSEETDESTEETKTVEKSMVLYIGNEDGNGNRYTSVEGSSEVHAISSESLSQVLDGAIENVENLTVSNIFLKDLESLTVNYGGSAHTFTLDTVTSEDDEEESKTVYYMDGEEMDTLGFSTFYNNVVAVTAQEMAEEGTLPKGDAELSFDFIKKDGSTVSVKYYPYDSNFYLAQRQDDKNYLVNKMKVRNLIREYQELIS
ncbi:DUF4340 domain-containing protein [Lawsonibacter sp. OA9]|uniref:DUF4340 domain-containing protein n=1 Tax=Oscillospiraceae TaxID=216572 RepID=UPI001F060F4E|nr:MULTISPECIES: DUF4340 domain-containing protein [Oscillospiraceae]MCH1980956.1 DUF4340 domain-containing protein [Lawsonibacter sp. OA9]MCH1981565.1 DUF4340 domain-containing protein [Ruminococcus sp. OA3]